MSFNRITSPPGILAAAGMPVNPARLNGTPPNLGSIPEKLSFSSLNDASLLLLCYDNIMFITARMN
jgi:hypothetical protein